MTVWHFEDVLLNHLRSLWKWRLILLTTLSTFWEVAPCGALEPEMLHWEMFWYWGMIGVMCWAVCPNTHVCKKSQKVALLGRSLADTMKLGYYWIRMDPVSNDWCPLKKRSKHTETTLQVSPREAEGQDLSNVAVSPGCLEELGAGKRCREGRSLLLCSQNHSFFQNWNNKWM